MCVEKRSCSRVDLNAAIIPDSSVMAVLFIASDNRKGLLYFDKHTTCNLKLTQLKRQTYVLERSVFVHRATWSILVQW